MTEEEYEKIKREVDAIPTAVTRDIEKSIRNYLDKCGLFYKCFVRVKSGRSLCEKLQEKIEVKGPSYKLQDLIGIRIVVYFKEDIALCEKLIEQHFKVYNVSKNAEDIENFGPQRINYVCEMPEQTVEQFDDGLWKYPIDKSFEIQIRTIFSEGWHEIEHDFRYKCKDEWAEHRDLSRTMNGIFATLDNCDWAISSLFAQVAYRHYKEENWIPMLKNVLRMRLTNCEGMEKILTYFNDNHAVAKQFFRLDRGDLLIKLSDLPKCPLTMTNVIYLVNLLQIHDSYIESMTPEPLRELVK